MARKANANDITTLRDTIRTNPGRTPNALARLCGWSREKTVRHLTTDTNAHVDLYEDDTNRIYIYERP